VAVVAAVDVTSAVVVAAAAAVVLAGASATNFSSQFSRGSG